MLFGYARVSTQDQNMALQLEALKAAGVDKKHIRQETISGTVSHKDRPVLKKLLARLKPGDILVIWKLDRLGRSVIDLMRISEMFRQRKVHLRSITENLDTSTPGGMLVFTVIAAVAEMERAYCRERVVAGIATAREEGRIGGRRFLLTPQKAGNLVKAYRNGESVRELAKKYSVAETTVRNYLARAGQEALHLRKKVDRSAPKDDN